MIARRLLVFVFLVAQLTMFGMAMTPAKVSAADGNFCRQHIGGFFGFPTWYKYLLQTEGQLNATGGCDLLPIRDPANNNELNVTYLVRIAMAVFEIVLRIAGMAALGYVLYGAFQFLTSRGEPDKYAAARTTVSNALIGLVIALFAVAIVNLVGANVI